MNEVASRLPAAAIGRLRVVELATADVMLQGGDYAVPIHRVQESVRVPEITRVPRGQWAVALPIEPVTPLKAWSSARLRVSMRSSEVPRERVFNMVVISIQKG